MKAFAVIAAATLATATAYSTASCPLSEYAKYNVLLTNPDLDTCQTNSGWQMLPPTGYPSAAQLQTMCADDACWGLIGALVALKPADCQLTFGTYKLNVKNMTDLFTNTC